MKAKREPLSLDVVYSDDAVEVDAWLRLYVGSLLAELRRGPVEIGQEVDEHETITIADGRECPRIGLLAFIA